jgi:hypothetical protein
MPVSDRTTNCSVDFDGLVNDEPNKHLASFMGKFDLKVSLPRSAINVVTGMLVYSPETILSQIVHALEISQVDRNKPVILWEHDVMYPPGYVEAMSAPIRNGVDYSVYYDHVFADRDGFFKPKIHFWHLSRYAAKISALHSHFNTKIRFKSTGILEPVPREFDNGEAGSGDIVDSYEVVHGLPVLDFKHGANAAGQILVDEHADAHPQWGLYNGDISGLFTDDNYSDFLQAKPDVGYGLFIAKSEDEW